MPFPHGPKWTTPAAVITASAVLLAMTSKPPVGTMDQGRLATATVVVAQGTKDAPKPQPPAQPPVDKKADSPTGIAAGPLVPVVFAGNLPANVRDAYRAARDRINQAQPGCHLPLGLLEAIGKIETNHARNGLVDKNGTTRTPILGPALDGIGFARIPDTEGGRLDGDTVWDRAVGPMQFIPTTWANWYSDGNGDNFADPHNLHDAAVAAARYLCADNRDLSTQAGLDQAILSYNRSESYRVLVLAWMSAYANGTAVVPDSVTPAVYVPHPPKAPTGATMAATTPISTPPPAQPPVAASPPVQPVAVTEPLAPPTATPSPTAEPSATASPTVAAPTVEPPVVEPPATTPPPTDTSPSLPGLPTETLIEQPVLAMACDVTGLVDGVVSSLTTSDRRDSTC
nr:lytic transglycosylase domain-containing protein [Kibdelosporangium sp. MJ126-NF4]CEL14117.1 putative secreted protein [Kibdelosporangium sp. MJ126-NF4]CTQ88484.1 putative secreted protein [Kibdelosporangium sp. MJ126-NF4]